MYGFKVKKRDGSELDLRSLKGKVLLIVNTATGCGFTPQYEGLENLYKKYHKDVNGDEAAPIYQYLKGEISDDPEPKGMKNKIAMKAISKMPGVEKEKGFIKWNFTKFLVNRDGKVVGRFGPTDKPEEMEDKIKELM